MIEKYPNYLRHRWLLKNILCYSTGCGVVLAILYVAVNIPEGRQSISDRW